MTDLEITRLCAEAMGIECDLLADTWRISPYHNEAYDPLHDDAQAMALVKRFAITTIPHHGKWSAVCAFMGSGQHASLNYAICECIANMQAAKEAA